VDALQLIIEQRDQILAEKDAELRIKESEVKTNTICDSHKCDLQVKAFAGQRDENRRKLTQLEEAVKDRAKEVARLREELEAARSEGRSGTGFSSPAFGSKIYFSCPQGRG
jgi:hypothetical protein